MNANKDESGISRQGPLAWMVQNRVAANCLAAILFFGGLLSLPALRQELFPEVEPEIVTVRIPYPGAGPEEVERGVVLSVEEEVRAVDGVQNVASVADEGGAVVTAELFTGTNRDRAFNDIRAAVERIDTFPGDVEPPVTQLPVRRTEVLSLILHGDFDQHTLHRLAEFARGALLRKDEITSVETDGLPPPEISVETPHEQLRRHSLTLEDIARRISAASLDLSAGEVRTAAGDVAIEIREERESGIAFEDIALLSLPGGTEVRLGDVADVVDGFRDTGEAAWFNNRPAVRLRVFRVGDQNPVDVSRAVREVAGDLREDLPETVGVSLWVDMSEMYRDRITLLVEKGLMGLVLVLSVLGVFLHPRLAVWVSLGIAIAFMGGFLVMPALGVSLNMISLFSFILVLGIVVDDAIVVGEAIHDQSRAGLNPTDACVAGVREIAIPVSFAVSTTILAFTPMLFVPGAFGDFFINLPLVVIPILLFSLIESFYVLPAHISMSKGIRDQRETNAILRFLQQRQEKVALGLERFVKNRYAPFAYRVIRLRYFAVACGAAILIVCFSFVAAGRIGFMFMSEIEGEVVTASIEMPVGTPVEETRAVVAELSRHAEAVLNAHGGESAGRGIFSRIGSLDTEELDDAVLGETGTEARHFAAVSVFLAPAEKRTFTAGTFSEAWRNAAGWPAGVERLRFEHLIGPAAGEDVSIRLIHGDWSVLRNAAAELGRKMEGIPGTREIDDGVEEGKVRINLRIKPEALGLGVTERDLAAQVRGAFHGAEADRQQRGRHELRIFARLPLAERKSEHSLETLLIRTPDGGEIPLDQAATLERVRAQPRIRRDGGRRVIEVTANVDLDTASPDQVQARMESIIERELIPAHPGLDAERSGLQEQQADAFEALGRGMRLALLIIYALMAVIFRSYLQPLVVMAAIPFGFAGALAGHLLLGFELSLISVLGLVALAGVVINDSLVLVYAVNDCQRKGMERIDAVVAGARRRFRPVLLTSLTAFLGLAPMIFETSIQARFLIPMALSLGFGVLLVTPIALVLVPALLMIVEDLANLGRRVRANDT